MESQHFDIAVIGGGPGGYATALRAAELELSVALINREQRLGGTCLNRGCIPSKALITATRSIHDAHDAARMGINTKVEGIDFTKLKAFKNQSVSDMTDGLFSLLTARKVTVFNGEASITAEQQIEIQTTRADTDQPKNLSITADDIVVATGSRPRQLPDYPFTGALIDSTQALDLAEFPKSAVIIGAGAVAVEFASMWAAAGVDVTLLIRNERVLSHADRRASMALTRALAGNGIRLVTHSHVTDINSGILPSYLDDSTKGTVEASFESRMNGYTTSTAAEKQGKVGTTVSYISGNDTTEHECTADVVLAAIGRDPNTDQRWFADAGIALDEHGFVRTDAYGHTSQPGLWALGDITQGPALAYRAFEQGIVIAESVAGLDPKPVNNVTVPEIVFSTPEFATVGMTMDEAKTNQSVIGPKESLYPMMGNARIRMSGNSGSLTLITGAYTDNPDTPVVLGAHLVAPDASDLIAEAQQLIGNRVPLSQAARLIHPHPTFSEAFGEVLLKADGRPLHTK
jgi:dihydrolipoamide dehydrogenase